MTREMKECLQSLTRECASPDLFREQSHSLASEAATQVKKQWDAHLKQSEKQNLHSHLAISSTKNANNNAKNAHRVRDPVKFPFGLAESEVKIRIPSEFSKHRILPNIASEGLQEAKKNLMLKYNKAPKNQLQVPLKRLTPVARVGGSGARIEDQVSIQQNNSSNEQTISQLLSIEKDAQESPHQEIIDSAALWEDVDELEVSTYAMSIRHLS